MKKKKRVKPKFVEKVEQFFQFFQRKKERERAFQYGQRCPGEGRGNETERYPILDATDFLFHTHVLANTGREAGAKLGDSYSTDRKGQI